MKSLDYDLGIFDPTFPGITVHFPTEAAWRHRMELASFLLRPLLEEQVKADPSLAAKKLDEPDLLERVLREGTGFALSAGQKEQLGQFVMDGDPDNAMVNLAIASAVEHERRHFHDFLLSPWAASLAAMRLDVCIVFPDVFRALRAKGANVIPVPLTKWLRKSQGEQQELRTMWQALLGDSCQVRLPELANPDLQQAVERIERRYRSLGVLFDPIAPTNLSTIAVFEASALLIQTQAIHDSLGVSASHRFLQTIVADRVGNPYALVIGPMGQFLRKGEVLEVRVLSVLVTWCLLGFNNADLPNANPLIRLNHVIGYLKANGFPAASMPAREILDALDRHANAVPYSRCLSESMGAGDQIIDQLEQALRGVGGQSAVFLGTALRAYANLHAWHKEMATIFLDDPDRYASPVAYLDENLGLWPEPPMRTTYGRPFFSLSRAELAKFDDVVLFEEESSDGIAVIRQHVTQMPKKRLEHVVAQSWQHLCGTTDLLFAEFNRDHAEVEYQRQTARNAGLYFMEVLD